MGQTSGIEWTHATWNPLVGCTKYSDGCKNCYAMPIAERFQRMGVKGYENGFNLTLRPERLDKPFYWKKPQLVFVDSMCDLFHDDVPLEYIERVFTAMKKADWHQYQILTKRSERLRELAPHLDWMPHVWAGVTIESDRYRNRIDDLHTVSTKNKWLSLEPLLTPIPRLELKDVAWVIVGGESGRNARPMELDWVREIHDWTHEQGKAFWFKQNSDYGLRFKEKAPPPMLDGKLYKEFPKFEGGEMGLF